MSNIGRVEGKVALVTGAGSGLGRAAACRLAEEGAIVIVTDVNEAGGAETVATIEAAGGDAGFMAHDVTKEDDWAQVVGAIMEQHGRLDVLVNNAGVIVMKPVDEMTLDEFRGLFAVNVEGVFLGLKYGVQAMKQPQRGDVKGSIINLSSVAGRRGSPLGVAYCGSKGAVRLMTKAVAQEMRVLALDIRVNSVHPAIIETPMAVALANQVGRGNDMDGMIGEFQGRIGSPLEVANAILYLASDESSFSTASELVVDGGVTN